MVLIFPVPDQRFYPSIEAQVVCLGTSSFYHTLQPFRQDGLSCIVMFSRLISDLLKMTLTSSLRSLKLSLFFYTLTML